jgi:hypothetical protein
MGAPCFSQVCDAMADSTIPSTLDQPSAAKFWLAVLLTGVGSGLSAVILLRLLQIVQHVVWPDPDAPLLMQPLKRRLCDMS